MIKAPGASIGPFSVLLSYLRPRVPTGLRTPGQDFDASDERSKGNIVISVTYFVCSKDVSEKLSLHVSVSWVRTVIFQVM